MTVIKHAKGGQVSGIDWSVEMARHGRWLRLVVLARLGERSAVDDVMQELALGVVGARHRPTEASRIAAWLYRLAIRQTLLYRRKQGRRRRLIDRYAERAESSDEVVDSDPLEWLLSNERARAVRQALGDLPPRDAEILLLKYASDWSYRQIADHLGVGVAAIEARLHRARARLREILARSSAIGATK
jgi:RNA polymerase sigma-70 factor (ECF subfamily)